MLPAVIMSDSAGGTLKFWGLIDLGFCGGLLKPGPICDRMEAIAKPFENKHNIGSTEHRNKLRGFIC